MLNELKEEVNRRLKNKQEISEFKTLLQEDEKMDFLSEEFNDDNSSSEFSENVNGFINESEGHTLSETKKNILDYFLNEATSSNPDPNLETNFQVEMDFNDNYSNNPANDMGSYETKFQQEIDFNDNYEVAIDNDLNADNALTKEIDYHDNQTTPVDVDPFSAESMEYLMESMEELEADDENTLSEEDNNTDFSDDEDFDEDDTLAEAKILCDEDN